MNRVYTDVHSDDPFRLPVPRRVLVVGGGPAGLVTLRNLVERGTFDTVQLVERRDDVGGVWYLEGDSESEDRKPRWPSAAYKGLVGNVLPEFLSFSGNPFPRPATTEEGQPFANIGETFAYLKAFASPYLQSGQIRLNTEVVTVEERPWGEGWKVSMRDWSDEGKEIEEIWDAVVVAVHWHDNAEWPSTPGLDELRQLGLAKHAKVWRGPQGHEGKVGQLLCLRERGTNTESKRCLVVGNANSSNDIAAQLAPVAQTPVFQSIRRPPWPGFPSLPNENIQMVTPVVQYAVKEGGPKSKFDAYLKDGTILEDLDVVLCGTGYYPFPDFVKVFKRPEIHSEVGYRYPPNLAESEGPLRPESGAPYVLEHVPVVVPETRPRRVPHLHRLSIYAPNPSLAFVGTVMTYTPFTTADVTSSYVALVLSHKLPIPSSTWDRLRYERDRLEVIRSRLVGVVDPTSFLTYSVMAVDEEGYGRALREDVVSVLPELNEVLPIWNEETSKAKENMFKIKLDALKWARDRGWGGNLEGDSAAVV
ncbi:hypothetical protein NMY22_g10227 [Coprinellus aureogranulatus]|nr:hypothetical protein NMY22_g10227 [Coprinellus aureogranulatus]